MDRCHKPTQIKSLCGNFRVIALCFQFSKQRGKLFCPFVFQCREFPFQQLPQVFLGNNRHIDDHKTGRQRFIQFSGTGIAIVHGSNETGCFVQRDSVIPRHVNGTTEVQCCMEHCQRLVLCHIDFIQYAETTHMGTAADRPFTEYYLIIPECICPNEGSGVYIYIKRNVPGRSAKGCRQIFCQHVFPSCFGTGQQQIFPT